MTSNSGSGDDHRCRQCPYLDTINRGVLDFDFEKLCSVSLSQINCYACLVCGKYFQGRGIGTHAYMHSVSIGHHVFLNLDSLRFYCLPDNYEIIDSSLDDITYVLNPTFTAEQIRLLDTNANNSIAYDGTAYLPGIVGLNNIKYNDYCNVVLQCLSHVPHLRDYFLNEDNYINHIKRNSSSDYNSLLVQRFGQLIRKLWNGSNFKAHVSPHEMLQAVVLSSHKKFQITEQGDPIAFLSWILNTLHLALKVKKGTKRLKTTEALDKKDNTSHEKVIREESSILYSTFRGKMKTYSRKMIPIDKTIDERLQLMLSEEYREKCEETPFIYLTLDLPPQPLFKDELSDNIIPQVPLYTILAKFNGINEKEYKTYKDSSMKRFELTVLPKYLILYIKRFTRNTFFIEKNPTIVNFPLKNVDFTELLAPEMRHNKSIYDLIANVVHEGEPEAGKGTYRCHVLHRGTGKWFELQDLHVSEILPQMITLSESYIQIWEKQIIIE
ncbi:U4/U6.U5 tri-snRNP-associated protein 2-like [Oppia nitens]|uniref:U4/U6.U5 tri-snRNP-associated protein 2-like n=1 Tax=Oppia nitens TaxID=1686743 RepID=UPI0023DBDF3E|nr:U4/U6.U5 tri-snRNP-associated protein 2-like [Oppia nitens]